MVRLSHIILPYARCRLAAHNRLIALNCVSLHLKLIAVISMISGGKPRDFAFPLLVAAIASIILVYCTGLLIGIMQYQSRISGNQNGLTIGQVIFFLDIENKIYSTIQDLSNDAKQLSDINTCYQRASEEVSFRISRVCSLLVNKNNAEVDNNFPICDAFLRKIPLDAKDVQKNEDSKDAVPE